MLILMYDAEERQKVDAYIGPRAIAEKVWSRSGQKIWILGLTAGCQSGQKMVKMRKWPDLGSGQLGEGSKHPKLASGQKALWLSGRSASGLTSQSLEFESR